MSFGSAKGLLDDAWVDTSISAKAPPCKSLEECGWNRSRASYADTFGSKILILSGASYSDQQRCNASAPTAIDAFSEVNAMPRMQFSSVATSENQGRISELESSKAAQRVAVETHAVRLDLLLGQSCMEFGPRACWQTKGSVAIPKSQKGVAVRELRPITVSFRESQGARVVRQVPAPTMSPLVASLRAFRFPEYE
jgi:hypothetical protein